MATKNTNTTNRGELSLSSHAKLDPALAWKRVVFAAANQMVEVPDRLPFVLTDRSNVGAPAMSRVQRPNKPVLVVASKKGGTVRPFVRLSPEDLHLYQALTDAAAPSIEAKLGSRTRIFGYRHALDSSENPFSTSPKWRDFKAGARAIASSRKFSHVLKADVSGFYMNVDVDVLSKTLLDLGVDRLVVSDLVELLRIWRRAGIRGLPQGVPASGVLANAYLTPLDQLLDDRSYVRYMDDFYVFANSYAEVRQVQDEVERRLYGLGLTLAGEKTKILRVENLGDEFFTVADGLDAEVEDRKDAVQQLADESAWDDYGIAEDFPSDADVEEGVIVEAIELAAKQIADEKITKDTQPAIIESLRRLTTLSNPVALDKIVGIVNRFPNLLRHALFYVAEFASTEADQVKGIFTELTKPGQFHRDQEWIQISAAALRLPIGFDSDLAARFAELATDKTRAPLVRGRALLAWGVHSPADDLSAAVEFWGSIESEWRPYAVVAIQDKDRTSRDDQYTTWASADPSTKTSIDVVRQENIGWRKV